ncbi:LEA type 2 family protein [Dyadobacter psychrotolerans]|nr:LEA type 2 family protein [Dyadobacter psychrotolerans]
MNLKRPFKILLILIVFVIAGVVAWHFYKKNHENPVSGLKPRVEMGIGRISNITDSTIDLSLNLLVHNPLPIGFDVNGFDYFVQMNGVTIIQNKYEEPLALKANDSTMVTLPSKLKIADLSKEGDKESSKGEDSADYHFETVFHFQKPILGKDSLTLSMDKRLPLYQLPKVEVVDFDMEKFRLSKSDVIIKLKFSNRNSFPIQFKNPSYVVDLGKQKRLAEGKVKDMTRVKAHSSEIYEIPLAINMGKVLKAAGQIITKGKELPFTLYFKSKLVSDNDIFKDSDVNIIVDGELRDIDTVKKNLAN